MTADDHAAQDATQDAIRNAATQDTARGAVQQTPGGADPVLLRRWRELAGGSVLLDGFHALKHALRFGAHVPVALAEDPAAVLTLADELAPDLSGELSGLLRQVPASALRALLPRPHPTGVAALAVRGSGDAAPLAPAGGTERGLADDGARGTPLVVLDNPRHLGNVGAVIRLAAGAGAAGVLTTGTVDPWHPHVVRASAGLHFATAVERRQPHELPPGPLYALDPEGDDIRSVSLPGNALLAFGSERHGLGEELRSRADRLIALPMRPQVSSYNLATSVAMTLYHWMAGAGPA